MNSRVLTLILLAASAITTGRTQTAEEYAAYDIAVREMEYAQRLIKEGLSRSTTPDMAGLDRKTDNSIVRKRGLEQVTRGKALATAAQTKIRRFQERQNELRKILSNKDRLMELESLDGRRGIFAIETITLPMVRLIRADMLVINITINQLSQESQARLIERIDPNVELVCDTSYGSHFFPIAYLAKPNPKKTILPVFSVRVKVTPTSKNIANDGNFEVKISSDWPAIKPKTQSFSLALTQGESDLLELPIDFDDKFFETTQNKSREINIEIKFGQRSVYAGKLHMVEHGTSDLPIYILEDEDKILDTKYLSACYIDETLPEFDVIKKRAIELKLVDSFAGSSNDISNTRNELLAIWHYLAEKGITCRNGTETGIIGSDFASQRMRTPSEIIASRQANSIDGSMLIASFAMSIGLDPILIIRPGHMYVAIRNSAKQLIAIEPTVINDVEFAPDWTDEKKISAVRSNFETAQQRGLQNLGTDIDLIERGQTISRYQNSITEPKELADRFQFVDIRQVRYAGIPRVTPKLIVKK